MKRIYTYFVSYTGRSKNGQVVGNTKIDINKKIKNIDQIRAIEKCITDDDGFENTVINNYILLSKRFGKMGGKNDKN